MRTFNVSFLAALSCIAMIGATSIGNRAFDSGPPELDNDDPMNLNRQQFVALQQLMEILTLFKSFFKLLRILRRRLQFQ